MTNLLRNQIIEKGLSASLFDKITGHAVTFNNANTSQEGLKQTTKEISKEVVDVFNSIYDELIGIYNKTSSYYQYDAMKKEQFAFSKVIGNLGSARKTPVEASPVASPQASQR